MSNRSSISRYLLILRKLQTKPYSSIHDILGYIQNQLEYLHDRDDTLNMGFSKRTLQRDFKELRNNFGMDIEYSKSQKGYFISQGEMENMNFQRMLEAFDMFNALNLAHDLKPFIHLENRRPQGTNNLYGLLHAIKNKVQISFHYQTFWYNEATQKTAEPLAMKEFKNRWYVLAKDLKDREIKSFALDRLTELEITTKKFEPPQNYNAEESYRYSFGIISPNGELPQDIILSFTTHQGKYIKTLPLHHTQQILIDNENELQVKLKLCITFDFIMELLSFGDNLRVIEPTTLIETIKICHQQAYEQYLK